MGTIFPVLCLLFSLVLCGATSIDDLDNRAVDPVAQLTAVAQHLNDQINNINVQVHILRTDMSNKKAQINTLSDQVKTMGRLVNNVTHQVNSYVESQTDLDSYIKGHASSLSDRITKMEYPVGFTVIFYNDSTANHTKPIRRDNILVYDRFLYKAGGDNYNTTTGHFVAPTDGTYAFFLTIQRNNMTKNVCLQADIRKNNHNLLSVASACPPGYKSASNMVTTSLRKGNTVHVQTRNSDQIMGFIHTSFTGIRLSTS